MVKIAVFGASGYSGMELLRLVAQYSVLELVAASSDRWAEAPIQDHVFDGPSGSFLSHREAFQRAQTAEIAFLATPLKTSLELAPQLLDAGVRVIDLSGAFRLRDPALYPAWYGVEHTAPKLLQEAHYGLCEMFPLPKDTRLIANPGCYATAAILSVAPLLSARLIEPNAPIIFDGKSGTTGAGRTVDEKLQFSEAAENVRPYRVGKHQHTPEIEQALTVWSKHEVVSSFTPHIVPMRRGLLVSAYVRARPGLDDAELQAAYMDFVQNQPLLHFSTTLPETLSVTHSNHVVLSAHFDPRCQTICAFAAIDNLVKGAAGQALQNMWALLGAYRS